MKDPALSFSQVSSCFGLVVFMMIHPCFAADVLPEGLRNPNKPAVTFNHVPEAEEQARLDIQGVDAGGDFVGGFFGGLLIPPATSLVCGVLGSRLTQGNPSSGAAVGILGGYLLGVVGGTSLICNGVGEPVPDPTKIAGRSASYQACYLDEFKKKGKNKKHHTALIGGIIGNLVIPGLITGIAIAGGFSFGYAGGIGW